MKMIKKVKTLQCAAIFIALTATIALCAFPLNLGAMINANIPNGLWFLMGMILPIMVTAITALILFKPWLKKEHNTQKEKPFSTENTDLDTFFKKQGLGLYDNPVINPLSDGPNDHEDPFAQSQAKDLLQMAGQNVTAQDLDQAAQYTHITIHEPEALPSDWMTSEATLPYSTQI